MRRPLAAFLAAVAVAVVAVLVSGLTLVWASEDSRAPHPSDVVASSSAPPEPSATSGAAVSDATPPSAATGATSAPAPAPGQPASTAPTTLPVAPIVDVQLPTTGASAGRTLTGADAWTIDVAASGGQPEIDRCLWTRMDFPDVMPLVAAHNTCGGGVVLEMQPGDFVLLHGQGLDGRYIVTGDRGAHGGDDAATATAGLDADVLLQTCLWEGGGRVRLVELTRL